MSLGAQIIFDLLTRLRDLTGITTDEASDTVLNQFITDAWEHVRDKTGRRWVTGELAYSSAEKAVIYFAAGNAYRRANFQDRAKMMDLRAQETIDSLRQRVTTPVMAG